MAKFTSTDAHFVRIGGITDGSGNVYTFLTAPASAGWSGTPSYALNTLVETKGTSIKFLGTMTAAPSISVVLRQAGSATAALLRKKTESSTVKSSTTGAVVRLEKFASKTGSTLVVTDSAPFTIGVDYWIGAQAFRVTAKPSSTTLTVSRGTLGTYATPIAIPQIAPTIHVHPATPKGLPVTAGVIANGAEEIRFRGFVDGIEDMSGSAIKVSVRSVIQHLRDAPYTVPKGRNAPTPISAGAHPTRGDEGYFFVRGWSPLEVDTEDYGPSVADGGEEWTRVRWVGSGGEWLVSEVTHLDTVTENGRQIDRYTPPEFTGNQVPLPVHAYGKNGDIYDLQTPKAQQEHIEAVFNDLDRAEWCYAYEDAPEWSTLLVDLLTRSEPYGSGMGIHTDYLSGGDADLPTAGIGLPQLIRNTPLNRDDWVMPAMESKKWSDLFRDGFLRPVFRGFGIDNAARVKALNWLEDPRTPRSVVSIGEEHLAGDAGYKMSDNQIDARGVYILRFGFEQRSIFNSRGNIVEEIGQFEQIVVSGDANQGDLAQADEIRIPGTLAGSFSWRDAAAELAEDALELFGVAVPQMTFEIQPTVNVSPGQRVRVTRSDIPSRLGLVDTTSSVTLIGFALGAGIDGGRITDLTIAVTGYADDPRPTLGTWAPISTVTAYSGGSGYATIEPNDWTDNSNPEGVNDDIRPWQTIDFAGGDTVDCLICDASLATLGTVTVTKAHDTFGLLLSSPSITPVAGHRIIPIEWDSQTAEAKASTYTENKGGPIAFLAGSNGKLGAADDDGYGWAS